MLIVLTTFLLLLNLIFLPQAAVPILIEFIYVLTDIYLPFLATLKKETSLDYLSKSVREYIQCPSCFFLYLHSDGGNRVATLPARVCTFVDKSRGIVVCDCLLYLDNTNAPIKKFMYHSLKRAIYYLYRKKWFKKILTLGKLEPIITVLAMKKKMTYLCFMLAMQIYWHKICGIDGKKFVKYNNFLLLSVNIDWYQVSSSNAAMSGSQGSVYCSTINLSNDNRVIKTNSILVAVIPGPRENSYFNLRHVLKPLVCELNCLFGGVKMSTLNNPEGIHVSASLYSVVCDLPAARKVMGATSYNSRRCCPNCRRTFSCKPKERRLDFSGGYNVENIPNDYKRLIDKQAEKWEKKERSWKN